MYRVLTAIACFLLFTTLSTIVQAAQYQIIDLGQGIAYDINGIGQVVGTSKQSSASYDNEAIIWHNGVKTFLGVTPWAGGSAAYCINDKGQVVGTNSTLCYGRAFLWENGTTTDLGVLPGYKYSVASSINNDGIVVGTCYGNGTTSQAFICNNGVMSALAVGGTRSSASTINNNGEITGTFKGSDGNSHSYLWRNGVLTDLGTLPSGTDCWTYDMNDEGKVVGCGNSCCGWDAFVWQDGSMTNLRTYLSASGSSALGINNHDQIVGSFYRSVDQAFLWQEGSSPYVLSTLPNARASHAEAINDSGMIVGRVETLNAVNAVLWEPVPEPSSILALLCGSSGVGAIIWRRKSL